MRNLKVLIPTNNLRLSREGQNLNPKLNLGNQGATSLTNNQSLRSRRESR